MTRTAAVVGGGIAGLAAAAHLQNGGWRVEVHERAAALPATGTALGLWPPALRALDTLGVGGAVRRQGRRPAEGGLLRADGGRIAAFDLGALERRTGGTVHLLSRPALLGLLFDALPDPGAVRFASPVSDLGALRNRDVVIVADGLHSAARTALFGDAHRPRFLGVTTWRGTVENDTPTFTETWGGGARFGISPCEGDRTNWFACVRAPEGQRSPGGEVAALRTHFGHWHGAVRSVLGRIEEAGVLRHDLYALHPPLPTYVRGNVALVGDAAHAMAPDLGRGACEAIVDAVTLAQKLVSSPSLSAALAAYDAGRRSTTQRLARMSGLVNRVAHIRHPAGLRDASVRWALAFGGPPA